MPLTLSFDYFCHIPKRIALPGRKNIYGVKSIVLNGLSWAVAAGVAYFIIRQWYVWGAFLILMIIDFVRTSALRYQFVIVDDSTIKFSSLVPFKKEVAINIGPATMLKIRKSNAFSWLVVTGESRVMRLQMHASEVRALQERLKHMGISVTEDGKARDGKN